MILDKTNLFFQLKLNKIKINFTKGYFIANHQIKIIINAINIKGKRIIKIKGPINRQINVRKNNKRIENIKRIDYVNKLSSFSNSFSYYFIFNDFFFIFKKFN